MHQNHEKKQRNLSLKMTNVKLKLMFFLLNSLLTADVVQARPYSDNSTDIVLKFTNSNNTFNIPVDTDSDTLVVAEDGSEVLKEKIDDLSSMMDAEQDRDEVMSEMKERGQTEQVAQVQIEKVESEDAIDVEQKLNISNPSLQEMIDSETNREDTITDLMFRPEAELVEIPRYEYLVAATMNSLNGSDIQEGLEKLENSSDVLMKDYVELVEVDRPKMAENMSAYMANITGHEVDNDVAPDTRFTDVQTLFLACFGTLLPLLAVLFATLFIRCMCRRWCPSCCKKSTGSSLSDSSEKQDTQLKSPTEDSVNGIERDSTPANGSIFTMTLKNNHLIVETEERNDITRNGRETKMKYSPDNDGIFVVEVQQSTAYRPSNRSLQNSPPIDPQISTNQALIHRVPEELEKMMEEDSERSTDKFSNQKALALSSTGLSISDLSMSSTESRNVSYTYSNQTGYEQGPFGYPIYSGYDIKDDIVEGYICENSQEPLISKTPTDPDKPVVTAAIFKQDSIIGTEALQGPGYCIEGSTDGPLLSDVQAREYSLQHLHGQKEKKLENGFAVAASEQTDSPKKVLNRADSLPVRLEEEQTPGSIIEQNNVMDTIEEDVPKEALKGKRASLPIITTDIYISLKDVVLPSGSPKFEKLMNDASPKDGSFETPMITITEESESAKPDSTS